MPASPFHPSPYATYVESKRYYIHPKTGMRASKAQIKKLRIKPTTFVYLRRLDDKKILERVKVTQPEKVMPVRSVTERSIQATLARYNAYRSIWDNVAGQIRITISGLVQGRAIKEIIHFPFVRRFWESRFKGYEQFKRSIVAIILSHLSQRGLRVSNREESRGRLTRLATVKDELQSALKRAKTTEEYDRIKEKIQSVDNAMMKQRRTKQVTRVNIRIEKLGKIGD